MTQSTLIKNARIVNENNIFLSDVLIENEIIREISTEIKVPENVEIIDAEGKFLIPGFIDDQVHFREPGLTHKANIATESRAAVRVELLLLLKCQILFLKLQLKIYWKINLKLQPMTLTQTIRLCLGEQMII